MKTIFNTTRFFAAVRTCTLVFAAVLCMMTTTAFANGTPDPEKEKNTLHAKVFQVAESMRFKAIIEGTAEEKFSVVIKNEAGKIIYSENLKSKGYYRAFDLSTLGDGIYTFELSNGNQSYTQSFHIETTTVRKVEVN